MLSWFEYEKKYNLEAWLFYLKSLPDVLLMLMFCDFSSRVMGKSAVCYFGILWSHSLIFFFFKRMLYLIVLSSRITTLSATIKVESPP